MQFPQGVETACSCLQGWLEGHRSLSKECCQVEGQARGQGFHSEFEKDCSFLLEKQGELHTQSRECCWAVLQAQRKNHCCPRECC